MNKVVLTHCSECRCWITRGQVMWTGHPEFCRRYGCSPDARASDAQHPRMKPQR